MAGLRQTLAFNMKKYRRALGFSQVKLAEEAGTAPTYIAMIELEKKFPSVDMLERIAAALKIDAPQLFSMQSYPAESLRILQKDLLREFESVIEKKLALLD